MAELDPRDIRDLTDEIRNLTQAMGQFSRAGIDLGAGLSGVEKKMQDVAKAAGKGKKNLEKQEKVLGEIEKAIDIVKKSSEDQAAALDKMGKAERRRIQAHISEYGKGLVKQRAILKQQIRAQKAANDEIMAEAAKVTAAHEKEARKRANVESKIAKSTGGAGRGMGYRKRDAFGRYYTTEGGKKEQMRSGGALRGVMDLIGNIKGPKATPSLNPLVALSRAAEARGRIKTGGIQLKEWQSVTAKGARAARIQALGATGGKALKFGAAAKGMGLLSTAIGGFLKVLPGIGWILTITSALAGLVKGAMNLEDHLTKLNKTFLSLAGPTSGIRDIPGAMKEFNNAIFDIRRNLKLGIKAKDIQDMFGAMAGAGMSLQGVKQNVGSYGKAIYEARVLSLEFGTSMQDMGKMMADQMLNVRSSLEEVSKGFRKISFDAARAGISSNKFWQAIQSSTSELSYFGDFIKSTSNVLMSFMEGAELGFRDAEKATKNLIGAFSGIDYRKGLRLMAVMGDDAKKILTDLAKEDLQRLGKTEAQIVTLQKELAGTTDEKQQGVLRDQITSLNKTLRKQSVRTDQLVAALESGDPSQMAVMIGRLAEKPITVVASLMNQMGDFLPAQIEYLAKILGVNQETVVRLKQNIQANKDGFQMFIQKHGKLADVMMRGDPKAAALLSRIVRERARGGSAADMFQSLDIALKTAGITNVEERSGFARDLDTMISRGMLDPLTELFSALATQDKDVIAQFQDQDSLLQKIITAMESGNSLTDNEMKSNEDRLDDLIKRTTSAKDYSEITREAFKYFGADKIGGGIRFISGLMLRGLDILGLIAKNSERELLKSDKQLRKFREELPGSIKEQRAVIETAPKGQQRLVDQFVSELNATGHDVTAKQALQVLSYEGEDRDMFAAMMKEDEELAKYIRSKRAAFNTYTKSSEEAKKKLEELKKRAHEAGFDVVFQEELGQPIDVKGLDIGTVRADPSQLGTDLGQHLRGKYDSMREARKAGIMSSEDMVIKGTDAETAGGPLTMPEVNISVTVNGNIDGPEVVNDLERGLEGAIKQGVKQANLEVNKVGG